MAGSTKSGLETVLYHRTKIPGVNVHPSTMVQHEVEVKYWKDASSADDDSKVTEQLDSTFQPKAELNVVVYKHSSVSGVFVDYSGVKGVVALDARGVPVDGEKRKMNISMRFEEVAEGEQVAEKVLSQGTDVLDRAEIAAAGPANIARTKQHEDAKAKEALELGVGSKIEKGKGKQKAPDSSANEGITLYAKRHNYFTGQLTISNSTSNIHFAFENKGKDLNFTLSPNSRIHMYPYSQGSTFRFINCGVLINIDAAPGKKDWTKKEDCEIHVLFEDTPDGAKAPKGYPTPDNEVAKENRKIRKEFLERMKEVVGEQFVEIDSKVGKDELDVAIRVEAKSKGKK